MQSLTTESEKREKTYTFVNTISRKNGILEKKGITKWFLNRMEGTNEIESGFGPLDQEIMAEQAST